MTATNRTAIVTGASRGIGRAIALRLATDGFHIAVNYSGDTESAEQTVNAIESAGGNAFSIRADVADADDVARLFDSAKSRFGHIYVVVNSAGIMPLAPIAPERTVDFDRVISVNLRGAFLVLAQAAQHLTEGGRIIALSPSVIAKSFPGYGPYIAAKLALKVSCRCSPINCEAGASQSMPLRRAPPEPNYSSAENRPSKLLTSASWRHSSALERLRKLPMWLHFCQDPMVAG